MISAVARPIPLANAVTTATFSANRMVPPFASAVANAFWPQLLAADEHGRTQDATRDSSAACGLPGDAGIDQTPRAACRGAGAERCLGQRAHHCAARAVSALALVLRPDPDPDLHCLG